MQFFTPENSLLPGGGPSCREQSPRRLSLAEDPERSFPINEITIKGIEYDNHDDWRS